MNLRSFGKNTLIYAVGTIGLRAVSFMLLPMFTHFLPVHEYGMLATLLITMQLMIVFMNMGMQIGMVRFSSEYERKKNLGTLLATTSVMNVVGGLIVTFFLSSFCLPFFRTILHSPHVTGLVLLACAGAFGQSICIHLMAFYRAQNRPFRFLASGMTSACILCIVTYFFIGVFRMGIAGALISNAIAYSTVACIVGLDLFLKNGVGFSVPLIPRLLKFGLPLIISASGHFIIWGVSTYFLSFYTNLAVVAVYSLGYRLTQLITITVILPFQLSFQPFIFSQLDSGNVTKMASRLFTYLLLSLVVISVFLLMGIRMVLPYIAPPEYAEAFMVVLILLPGVASVGVYYFGETIMGAAKKTPTLASVMSLFAAISLISNLILIPRFGWYGAAVSSDVSFILMGYTLLRMGNRNLKIPYEVKRITLISAVCLVLFCCAFLLSSLNDFFFFSGMTVLLCLSALLFITSSFLNEQEKILLKNAFSKVKSVILA